MDAQTVVIVLAMNLLSSGGLFFLIAQKMPPRSGLGRFAAGASIFGAAYLLRIVSGVGASPLLGGLAGTSMMLGTLLFIGGIRQFIGRPPLAVLPTLATALLYAVVDAVALAQWGLAGRFALLNGVLALLYGVLALVAARGSRQESNALRAALYMLVSVMGLLAVMTLIRSVTIGVQGELAIMEGGFAKIYYAYASLAATLLGPNLLWLVFLRLNQQLAELASKDPLTRTLNRNGLQDALRRHFGAREPKPLTWLQVDLDHFKQINDDHGHATGDAVLKDVSAVLTRLVRAEDFVARTGGEEFLIACVGANSDTAQALAERLRQGVAASRTPIPSGKGPVSCTVSIGVSLPFHGLQQWELAAQEADRALYVAKNQGRNRVVMQASQTP